MYEKLLNKEAKLAVIGLGYVGLPIALEFAKHLSVIGFDINQKRVDMMNRGEDPSKELDSSEFDNKDIVFTASLEDLREANFFIVAVPTPIDEHNKPDLTPLLGASNTVGQDVQMTQIYRSGQQTRSSSRQKVVTTAPNHKVVNADVNCLCY